MPARLLEIPEILGFIFGFSDPADDFNLLRVCRAFYKIMTPLVWENVKGVQNLLSLISDVRCIQDSRDPDSTVLKIRVPDRKLDFRRFELYAPFVRCLEVYDDEVAKYEVSNWAPLLERSRDSALLPKLVRLSMSQPLPSGQVMMWTQMFLSPSLLEISVPPPTESDEALLSHLEAAALLRYIGTTCQGLRRLSVFPDHAPTTNYKKSQCVTSLLMEFWDGSLAQQFARFNALCELCTTTEALDPGTIVHLAKLPSLEKLAIYPTSQSFEPTTLALSNPFPALRTFSLEQVPHTLFARVCKLQILQHITSLRLTFATFPDEDEDEESLWAISLITLAWNNCPALFELSVDFAYEGSSGDFLISLESIMFPMKGLPLRKLSLRPVVVCAGWELVQSIWPQLEVLQLPRHPVTPQELLYLAGLPRLERLVIKLSLNEPLPNSDPLASQNANLRFHTLQSSSNVSIDGDVYRIAQWLLSLWPALKCIERCDDPDGDDDDDDEDGPVRTTILALKRMVDILRELNITKSRLSSKPYGQDALKLFSL